MEAKMDLKMRVKDDIANMEEACKIPGGSAWIIYSIMIVASDIAYVASREPILYMWFYMFNLLNTATYILHRRVDTFAYQRGNTAFLRIYFLMMILPIICKIYLTMIK